MKLYCSGMKSSKTTKITILLVIMALFVAARYYGIGEYLTLDSFKSHQQLLQTYLIENPVQMIGAFFVVYVLSTALSLPGATILTLAGGALFGLGWGFLIVSFASTLGATLAFLGSRFLFKDLIQNKFSEKLASINEGIKKEGSFYLLTLRLVPIFPFFLINLVMGLTSIKVSTFFFISQIGMIPGTLVYVNAGTEIAKIDSLKGILSPTLLASFFMMGLLPLLSQSLIRYLKNRKFLSRYQKPKKFDYNMIVIGAGSAGLVSAYIAAAVKAKVALIEKHKMGGDCLNTGCVPSKALIKSAKIHSYIKRADEFGLDPVEAQVNFPKIMERIQKVIQDIEPHDSVERYQSLGVDCIKGTAMIQSPYEVEVNGKVLTTKNIVIATGAGPLIPKIPGLNEVSFLTSDNIWQLKELPKKLVVLGGGPIGCELAQSFARLGSEVYLVEMNDRLLSKEDPDVSVDVQKRFVAEGVHVLTGHRALKIKSSDKSLVTESQGLEKDIPFDQIIVALGRKANITGFGLEKLGIEISKQGTVVADEFLRTTNYPNIYTCGDVTGPYQFTHTASHQAWYVAVNALFSPFKKFAVDYRVIPWCTFTDPEVARVGLNELEAKEKNISYEVTKYGIDDLDRAIADSEAHGFVKVLTKPGSDKILGVTIVGHHAGDIISEYVTAMKYNLGLNKILGTIHIYPTLSEANKFAAGNWKKAHAPKKVLEFLKSFHQWRRN